MLPPAGVLHNRIEDFVSTLPLLAASYGERLPAFETHRFGF
jgi:hypothetical protein